MAITLLDMLKNARLINQDQFDEALRNRVLYGGKIGTSLIELGYVRENDLARFLSSKLALPYVSPERLLAIPADIIGLVPSAVALKYRVIPIHRDKKRLYLVMADPTDLKAIDEISFITGFIIKPLVTPEIRLIQALGKYYQMEIDQRHEKIISRIEQEKHTTQVEPIHAAEQAEGNDFHPAPAAPADQEPAQEEPELPSEEEWISRIGRYSIDNVSKTLARAEDREEIARILMGYLGQEYERVALFVVQHEVAFGWKAVYQKFDVKDFEKFNVPFVGPSVLKTVAEGMSYYLGTIPDTPLNLQMLQAMGGGTPPAALLMPLVIAGRVVNILYLEGGEKYLGDRFVELHKLLTKTALAFEILIFREKILMT